MPEEKMNQAINGFPQYAWGYSLTLLNELLQNKDEAKIAFESIGKKEYR